MSELQQNRYDQLLRRVGDLKGPGSKVNDVLTELFPMVDVENVPIELMLYSGWRHGMASNGNAAVALNFVLSQIFNPAASGIITVPTRLDIWSATAQVIGYALTDTALASLISNDEQRDSRIGIGRSATSEIRTAVQVAAVARSGFLLLVADTVFTLQDGTGLFVLAPGTGVTFFTTVLNTDFNVNYLWRERVAQPSELNL